MSSSPLPTVVRRISRFGRLALPHTPEEWRSNRILSNPINAYVQGGEKDCQVDLFYVRTVASSRPYGYIVRTFVRFAGIDWGTAMIISCF